MLDDCAEYSSALSEAAAQRPPPRVRQLYVTIIAQCEIASPSELFQANKEAMWADYKGGHVAGYHAGWLEDKTAEVQERCLTALLCAELLMLAYKTGEEITWSDLGLPVQAPGAMAEAGVLLADAVAAAGFERASAAPATFTSAANAVTFADPVEAELRVAATLAVQTPSEEQQNVIDRVLHMADARRNRADVANPNHDDDDKSSLFFVNAGAGTGKTFTLGLLVNQLRAAGYQVRAMASSGIAATLLPSPSRTVHSTLKVPLHVAEMDKPRLSLDDKRMLEARRQVWAADVFIHDEVRPLCLLTSRLGAVVRASECFVRVGRRSWRTAKWRTPGT